MTGYQAKKRTLNVVTDLGFRNVPAGNLTISKYPPSKNSELLFYRWLPLEDEDTDHGAEPMRERGRGNI